MSEARSYDYQVQYEVRVRVNVNARTPEEAAEEAQKLIQALPLHAEVIDPRGGQSLVRLDQKISALTALRAVFEDLDSTGRAGDEWAYEWIHETWPSLVPPVVRKAVGDREALEET